eukprot:m.12307 g.12307  ORF g.12307 m.12307 type:complete len:56 (+) comp23981_c0_seq1:1534-1701(+)
MCEARGEKPVSKTKIIEQFKAGIVKDNVNAFFAGLKQQAKCWLSVVSKDFGVKCK